MHVLITVIQYRNITVYFIPVWRYNCIPAVLYPYQDETRDIRSNIPLSLKEFPRTKPEGTPEGKGVYLTLCPELSPNTDSISLLKSLG